MRRVKLLSVVVPCHNEEEVLPATHRRLSGVLQHLLADKKISAYELVYVDNGSTDRTLEELEKIFDSDPRVKVTSLRRNYGYQGSVSAGLSRAKGDAVITMDADLQEPPEKMEEMISFF